MILSLLRDLSLDDSKRSLRYEPSAVDASVIVAPDETHTKVVDGDFLIGPVNDLTFPTLPESLPASLCGPFATERAFLEAFGYRDECGGTKIISKFDRWPIERMFEIYDVIRPLYGPRVDSSAPFHFSHADLSGANLIVDPESAKITGLIDWEMAGFRPAWLCATSRTWFNDDMCRFVVQFYQDGPETRRVQTLRCDRPSLPSWRHTIRLCWSITGREWSYGRCSTVYIT